MPLAVVVAAVVVAVLVGGGDDSRGELYAFDPTTGTLRWHGRFMGVDPIVSITGGVVQVDTTVGSGCEPGRPVTTRFNGRSGRIMQGAAALPDLREGVPLVVSVNRGEVRVSGRHWHAHVMDRGQPVGPAATGSRAGYVYVAVGGKWGVPCDE